ncbi:hypothetical protein ACPFUC_001949 [Vibrio cholerae]
MIDRKFNGELQSIQNQYHSLLTSDYLLREIALCEAYVSQYPELAKRQDGPLVLANSARMLLLNGKHNTHKHQSLPLFHGWSTLDIEKALVSQQSIPVSVMSVYQAFNEYRRKLGKIDKECVIDIL